MGLALFGTVLSLNLTVTNTEIQLGLGVTTLVHLTATSSFDTVGMLNTGGNVDGLVVCFINEGSNGVTFLHESSLEVTLGNRFVNFGNGNKVVAANAAVWYRYNGATIRWHHIASSS